MLPEAGVYGFIHDVGIFLSDMAGIFWKFYFCTGLLYADDDGHLLLGSQNIYYHLKAGDEAGYITFIVFYYIDI